MKQFIKSLLSSAKGSVSSKRLMGVWIVLITTGCLAYGVLTEGITPNIAGIMDTFTITAAGLLGVDSVTEIWSGRKNSSNNSEDLN